MATELLNLDLKYRPDTINYKVLLGKVEKVTPEKNLV